MLAVSAYLHLFYSSASKHSGCDHLEDFFLGKKKKASFIFLTYFYNACIDIALLVSLLLVYYTLCK